MVDGPRVMRWITPIAASVSLLSVAAAAWVGVLQYKLNSEAEQRLRESAQSESDVRMATLFVDLARLAQGRERLEVSDACVTGLFEAGLLTHATLRERDSMDNVDLIGRACVVNVPVGLEAQNAAAISIGVLGREYEGLEAPARQFLTDLEKTAGQEEVARQALRILDGEAPLRAGAQP